MTMRKKHESGLTAAERAILARLRKGPAALSSLAWAARCKSESIRVMICRLRRKLPAGETIPRSMYGYQTYSLETKPGKKGKGTKSRNNLLCAPSFLPDYTLCEWFRFPSYGVKNLARATILRSWYIRGVKWGTAWSC